jgi:hypothetical protein
MIQTIKDIPTCKAHLKVFYFLTFKDKKNPW